MKTKIIEYFEDKIIEIIDDTTYTNNYDFEYFLDIPTPHGISKHGIIIKQNDKIINSAIVFGNGSSTTVHKHSYYINDTVIIVCCGNSLFSLTLPELQLNWKIEIDEATAFGIYKMNDDYIIHGELTINRIDTKGKIIWKKYGSDIFVTMEGQNDFKIGENFIYVKSWDGRKYKFNYNGKDEYTI
ncbi:hypothetical protein ACYULU_02225 [Breznakiellaceae bacterium SP9]